MLKNKIRNLIKKLYFKLNPSHRYILRIDATITDLQNRMVALERPAASLSPPPAQMGDLALEKLFLASDVLVYRYLYLLRYMKGNCTILDVEGEYGTGVDMLYRYTPADRCVCLNSIDWYTKLGKMYYKSVQYKTGSVYDVEEKYDIITVLHGRRTALFEEKDYQRLYEMLEYGGILALALDCSEKAHTVIELLSDIGLRIEAHLYQVEGSPELLSAQPEDASHVLYFSKYE